MKFKKKIIQGIKDKSEWIFICLQILEIRPSTHFEESFVNENVLYNNYNKYYSVMATQFLLNHF